jgi:PII-like signaling protein
MRLEGPARRLTVFVDETDRAPHSTEPLCCDIVHLAPEAGLAGPTVFHRLEGYGASRHLHVDRILSLSPDLPVAVVIVDTPEKVDAFLPRLQELVTDGLITVDDLRAIGRGAPLCHPGGAPQSFDRRPVTVRPRGCGQASQVPRVQPRPTAPNPPSRLAATLATA